MMGKRLTRTIETYNGKSTYCQKCGAKRHINNMRNLAFFNRNEEYCVHCIGLWILEIRMMEN